MKRSKRIREATVTKIPYILIIGDKEIQENTVSVRKRIDGDQGSMAVDAFWDHIQKEIEEKTF